MARRDKPIAKPKPGHPAFADLNISKLWNHTRAGKKLSPPLAKLENRQSISWVNEGIPDILWACLLAGNLEREHYLELFRRVAVAGRENLTNYESTDLTQTKIATLSSEEFSVMFGPVLSDDGAKHVLASTLFLGCLPDRALWAEQLREIDEEEGWRCLAQGVIACIDHQSEQSTDVRWIKLMYLAITGRMRFPEQ